MPDMEYVSFASSIKLNVLYSATFNDFQKRFIVDNLDIFVNLLSGESAILIADFLLKNGYCQQSFFVMNNCYGYLTEEFCLEMMNPKRLEKLTQEQRELLFSHSRVTHLLKDKTDDEICDFIKLGLTMPAIMKIKKTFINKEKLFLKALPLIGSNLKNTDCEELMLWSLKFKRQKLCTALSLIMPMIDPEKIEENIESVS